MLCGDSSGNVRFGEIGSRPARSDPTTSEKVMIILSCKSTLWVILLFSYCLWNLLGVYQRPCADRFGRAGARAGRGGQADTLAGRVEVAKQGFGRSPRQAVNVSRRSRGSRVIDGYESR